jgi:hypothetical protein
MNFEIISKLLLGNLKIEGGKTIDIKEKLDVSLEIAYKNADKTYLSSY